ncbi:MAG: hypothetical protein M1823_001474 [Watsoniomyces obsoletus]|nr:MAG: hypothetical protein M1823_001474 [Watsoniomyces obsoletus]
MDPDKIQSRKKYKQTKPQPVEKSFSPLQQQLNNNPYAHALASPIRQCGLTKTRLPKEFLLSFSLVAHPETAKPWLLPQGLLLPPTPKSEHEGHNNGTTTTAGVKTKVKNPPRPPPGSYIIGRQAAMKEIVEGTNTDKKKEKWKDWGNLIRPFGRWKHDGGGTSGGGPGGEKSGPKAKEVVFREDMADFITSLYRDRVVKELREAVRLKTGVFVRRPKKGREEGPWLGEKEEVVSLLWLGRRSRSPQTTMVKEGKSTGKKERRKCEGEDTLECLSDEEESNDGKRNREEEGDEFEWDPEIGPPPFTRLKVNGPQGGYAMVYNLPEILGRDHLEELLRGELEMEHQKEYLLLKSMPATVGLQRVLWQFQGYLEPVPDS